MRKQKKTAALWAIFVSLALAWVLGCGPTDAPAPTPTPTPTLTPQALLSASASRVAALKSLAFTLKHERGSTALMAGVAINELEGQVDLPDRFSVDIKAQSTGLVKTFIRINVIAANEKVYMTNPISRRWQEISPDILPFDLINLGNTLAEIMSSINNPVMGARQVIDGQSAIRIQGAIASRDLSTLIPGAAEDLEVELEVWIQEDSLLAVQARIEGPVVTKDPPDIVRILTFESFNEPVTITPPL